MNLAPLRGGLIVSIQPEAASVLNTPAVVALLARCAIVNGAVGVRIEGAERIAAVRAAVDVPIVGLVKRQYAGFAPYITPTATEIDEAAGAGADIIAFDATERARPGDFGVAAMIAAIHARGRAAMADCATAGHLHAAAAAGADVVGTTLAGYTDDTRGRALPAVDLLREAHLITAFVILEGGIAEPGQVRSAFDAGADAVVVGTALTNIDGRIRAFATEVRARKTFSP